MVGVRHLLTPTSRAVRERVLPSSAPVPPRSLATARVPGPTAPADAFALPRSTFVAEMVALARDPLRLALAVLMLLTIGRLHNHFGFLMPLRPALLTISAAALMAIALPKRLSKAPFFSTWPTRVVVAIAALAVLGMAFGLSFGASAVFVLDVYSKVLIFWLLLVISIRNGRDLRILIWSYVLAAAFLCYLSIFVFGSSAQFGSHVQRLDSDAMYMYDPNDIGLIMMIALPLAMLLVHTAGRLGKIVAGATLLGIGWSVALSGSRGAFVGLAIVGLAMLVMLTQVPLYRRLLALGAVAGALVVAAPEGYWVQMQTMLDPEKDYNLTSEDGRTQIWRRGIGYMWANPVTGLGIANFGRAEGTISSKARNREEGTGMLFTAAHNSFVQVGAELGIPGLILWSALPIGGFVGIRRLRRRLPKRWETGDAEQRFLYAATLYLPIAHLGFAATAFFVSFAYLDPVYVLAAFTTGVYVSVRRRLAEEMSPAGVVTSPHSTRCKRYAFYGAPVRARPAGFEYRR